MRQPVHAIHHRKEMTPERIVGIGFVALLHVIVVWAIVTGLMQRFVKPVPQKPIQIDLTHHKNAPPPKPVEMPVVKLPEQRQVIAPPPLVIHDDAPPPPLTPELPKPQQPEQHTPAVPDTTAAAIAGTHTIPPYPALERRFGNQGTVTLKLTISPQGAVVTADIVQSSGFPGLDQAAQSWVMQHWRYKPASRGGQPVASTSIAAVVFSMRNAG